ncbi:hypothetical protein [Pseudomonas monsensis]
MDHSNRQAPKAGTLDEDFADAGVFRLTLPALGRQSHVGGISSDSASTRLYFAGQAGSGVADQAYVLGCLTLDGKLDPTFGNEGIASGAFTVRTESKGRSVICLSDGKKLLLGTVAESRPALARFTSAGVLDSTFGDQGYVILRLPAGADEQTAKAASGSEQASSGSIVSLNDGKILVVYTYAITHGEDTQAFLYLLNSDGSLDTSFNNKGYVQVLYPGAAPADVKVRNGLIDQDGKLVICGALAPRSGTSAALFARYLRDGSLDPQFGNNGFVIEPMSGSPVLECVIQQPNKRLLGIGKTGTEGLLISLEPDGEYNIQFNRGKPLLTRLEYASTYWSSGVMQPDGKIVLVGKYQQSDQPSPAVIGRMLSDGSFDSTFGNAGWVGTPFTGALSFDSLALQADGKIVVAGTYLKDSTNQGWVLRYHGRD